MIIYEIFWNGLSILKTARDDLRHLFFLTSHLRTPKEFPESTPVVNQGPNENSGTWTDLDMAGHF